MERKALRIFIVLAVLSLIGMVVVQAYWFGEAYKVEQNALNHRIDVALKEVARRMLLYQHREPVLSQNVRRIEQSYFTVTLKDPLNASILQSLLTQELARQNVLLDFEYAIFDCNGDNPVSSAYVCIVEDCDSETADRFEFPTPKNEHYYFGIHFPGKRGLIYRHKMQVWIVSTSVVLIVVLFFAYAIFFILRQRKLSELHTDFINNMTHEFKTPIATISIASEVLMNPETAKKPERLLRYATTIHTEINRLRGQVENVLQNATLDKRSVKLNFEEVNLHELIQDLIKSWQIIVEGKQGHLLLELGATHPLIRADRMHIANVLNNLIDNGIKYSREKPEISITTYTRGDKLVLEVEDNGQGISRKNLQYIFNRFYRVPTGNVHNVKGFGLGLFYVKTMIQAHRGQIKVRSKVSTGTKFTITLPVLDKN